MKLLLSILVCFFTLSLSQPKEKNVDSRVEALLKQMTLDEKIGQMTQVDYDAIKNHVDDIAKYSIGSILWGGNSEPPSVTPQGWADVYDSFQKYSQNSRLKIPIIFGIDAVHGHNNVNGAVIFPHNVGLGATRNSALVAKVAEVTSLEIKGTGIQWDFAPCVAVARNERWGRTYESYGEDPELVKTLGAAYVKGMQGENLSDKTSTLACVKHFLGDGGTTNGKDQGNTECDEVTLRKIHMPGYVEAIKAGAKSIMVSYNSWNGVKMHGNKYLLTDVLKKELGFKGFLVSDWAAIDQLDKDYKTTIEKSINAGLDMIMIPNGPGQENNYIEFITLLKQLVKEKKVPISRIDDAVRRVLSVKYDMNISENLYADKNLTTQIGSAQHREVGREAVRQSLVLLKNDNNVLPLSKNLKKIYVAGNGADSVGMLCGGWTIDWQGNTSRAISGGTSILQAIKNTVSRETQIIYSADGSMADSTGVAVVVVGEEPYAEMFGDRSDLSLSKSDAELIDRLKSKGIQVVVILISGRPLLINASLEKSTAFVAAWLPGTEGQGIADVLFGDFNFVGKLPHTWPKTMEQIPINVGDANYAPLFPYGFGLTYKK
ncbi:MAG: glycoside hydrolase family 3 N-terminal domain-containing protein [Bacteroidota bacterium]|nr:glycoside hydrolase family 3 N-terminal domain-containing protein [Bacteroidota bacterium]